MASSCVFPGGATEPGEDARVAAARELFEEAGVLLARGDADTVDAPTQEQLRARILGGAPAAKELAAAGLHWATDALAPWSHWITPSIESKRFSARFFVAELPAAQEPRFDDAETVAQVWLPPPDPAARSAGPAPPPPQRPRRGELARHARTGDGLAPARAPAAEPHPIMPRLARPRPPEAVSTDIVSAASGTTPCLLLPWDPDYTVTGTGDAAPLTYQPSWAIGPSRFIMEERAWKHVAAPGSTSAA